MIFKEQSRRRLSIGFAGTTVGRNDYGDGAGELLQRDQSISRSIEFQEELPDLFISQEDVRGVGEEVIKFLCIKAAALVFVDEGDEVQRDLIKLFWAESAEVDVLQVDKPGKLASLACQKRVAFHLEDSLVASVLVFLLLLQLVLLSELAHHHLDGLELVFQHESGVTLDSIYSSGQALVHLVHCSLDEVLCLIYSVHHVVRYLCLLRKWSYSQDVFLTSEDLIQVEKPNVVIDEHDLFSQSILLGSVQDLFEGMAHDGDEHVHENHRNKEGGDQEHEHHEVLLISDSIS